MKFVITSTCFHLDHTQGDSECQFEIYVTSLKYALLMFSNYLKMIKIDWNVSKLWHFCVKNIYNF